MTPAYFDNSHANEWNSEEEEKNGIILFAFVNSDEFWSQNLLWYNSIDKAVFVYWFWIVEHFQNTDHKVKFIACTATSSEKKANNILRFCFAIIIHPSECIIWNCRHQYPTNEQMLLIFLYRAIPFPCWFMKLNWLAGWLFGFFFFYFMPFCWPNEVIKNWAHWIRGEWSNQWRHKVDIICFS